MKLLFIFIFGVSSVMGAVFNTPGDKMLARYFQAETDRLAVGSLADVKTLEDWDARKDRYRREMHEMLGLDPAPKRTPLKATVTGKLDHDDFEVWKLHYQSIPRLYVTANLYVPKGLKKPAPAILYVCGHGKVKKDGVSYGNKVHYQHHGIWFARHGYVCLTIDTLQLGEIEGIHHGTYNHGMWWWNSRGYSSASVEAWNSIRALDYLETLDFVDKNRFGVTGRSGGGAYSWWISVLDERIKVSAPVAGITSLKNHVYAGFQNSGRLAHGVVEGHCDSMFHVNTYRWDFDHIAALVAPRPLMILNTDDDRIFPLDGVTDVFNGVRRIYDLHGQRNKLGLTIVPGGHSDTQPLQVPAFNWFNRHLKGEEGPITVAAVKLFEPEQLKVFNELPVDSINADIQETFTQLADDKSKPSQKTVELLRTKTFRGWPAKENSLNAKRAFSTEYGGVVFEAIDFDSQEHIRLRAYIAYRKGLEKPSRVDVEVLNEEYWNKYLKLGRPAFADVWGEELELAKIKADAPVTDKEQQAIEKRMAGVRKGDVVFVAFMPRGFGLSAMTQDERHITHSRRRFMLLGQTLAGMQVWDVRRCVRLVQDLGYACPVTLWGYDTTSSQVALAALFEQIATVHVKGYPENDKVQPDYLNISRVATPAQILELTRQRSQVNVLDQKKKR